MLTQLLRSASIELKDARSEHGCMSGGGEGCIVAASYQSHGDETVVELWLRAREGHSTLLLVHGLRPFLEIAILGKMENIDDSYIETILDKVRS